MSYIVDNAIIMAAGLSTRFAPLSYELPKSLISVKGDVLIERQIQQLQEVGINSIYIIVGYQAYKFKYLEYKYNVKLIYNPEYSNRNNYYSLYLAKDFIRNSYICCADNYFVKNPFELVVEEAYYSAIYVNNETKEWCISEDKDGYINKINIGGKDSWIMIGNALFSEKFSKDFFDILIQEIDNVEMHHKLWEQIYAENLDKLKMKIKKYPSHYIYEFDTLDELRVFDSTYIENSRSSIIKEICEKLSCKESLLSEFMPIKDKHTNNSIGFSFVYLHREYTFLYESKVLEEKNLKLHY